MRVRAGGRGNIGTIKAVYADGCDVEFVSPRGTAKMKWLPNTELTPIGRQGSDNPAADRGPTFELLTAAELDAGDFELEYLVPGVAAAMQQLILAGQFKTLKTSVAFDMAVSLATKSDFLGRFTVPTCRRVLILTAESGLATVQETLRRQCRSRGVRLGEIEGLSVCDRVPRLDNPGHIKELHGIIESEQFDVVVADPAYLMIDGDNAGNLFAMGEQLRAFSDLTLGAGATPILLHHAKKNNLNATDYQPLELQDLAWAGFAEFARQWLLLSRRERYVEGSGEHRLWMSVGGSAGHNGCWGLDIAEGHPDDEGGRRWDVSIDDAREARERAAENAQQRREEAKAMKERKSLEANREKVIRAFQGIRPPRLTKKQIRDRGGLNASSADTVIGYMLRTEELRDGFKIKAANKQEYDGFELNYEKLQN
jgi:hypothetical protein